MIGTVTRGAALQVSALTLRVGRVAARRVSLLESADWSLPAGTQAALCGPSGSGKTTLLHALAGIEPTAPGSVRWSDVDVSALRPLACDAWRRANVGFVFQRLHLFPGLDALGNVLLPFTFGAIGARVDARRRAEELLGRIGVEPHADVRVLSRGEQQRVSIVRAVCGLPRIVLADEPTASLDRESGQAAFALLADLCRDTGATLVVATHDESLAARLDEVRELRARRLVAMEPPA